MHTEIAMKEEPGIGSSLDAIPARSVAEDDAVCASRGISTATQSAFEFQLHNWQIQTGGVIGFSVKHIESGDEISVNGHVRFKMASTAKVPIAACVLAMVDRNEIRLDQIVEISPREIDALGDAGPSLVHPGVMLSVPNLIELMLVRSSNTATDSLLRIIGGPQFVAEWLQVHEITDLEINSTFMELSQRFYELSADTPPFKEMAARFPHEGDRERYDELVRPHFEESGGDTTSPHAMTGFLAKALTTSDVLSQSSRALLTGAMGRCQTAQQRIKGLLPAAVPVFHKSGWGGGTVSDVGLVTLPQGRGRLIISAYIKLSDATMSTRDRAIAELARSAYDYFATR
jgi:beta-lactamase class A